MNSYERDNIILAALLHDIGKFYQRAFENESELSSLSIGMKTSICPTDKNSKDGYSHHHVIWTNEFFEKNKDYFPKNISLSIITDNCANLASYHHKPDTPLKTIIEIADKISAGMDRLENDIIDEIRGSERYKKVRLHSIFEKINLESNGSVADAYRYDIRPLLPIKDNVFPQDISKLDPPEGKSLVNKYNQLWQNFISEFRNLPKDDFNIFLNSLIFLLEKYTWCIPSSTIDFPDISLFDHLKTTAAIAVCLYEFHKNKNSLTEDSIRNNDKKFILLGGDLSGIQRYIFNFSHSGVKGISKRLRARSFYLSILTNITSHFILNQLDLPLVCNIINAGGRFITLLPNLDEIKRRLNKIYSEINEWYYKTFKGELLLNLDWSLELSRDDFKIEKFSSFLEKLNENIEEKKKQQLFEFLYENNEWREEKFVQDINYPEGICESCGKMPAENNDGNKICSQCNEQEKIGEWLIKKKILCYSTSRLDFEEKISFFDGKHYIYFFEDKNKVNYRNFYLIEELYDPKVLLSNYGLRFIANYVPVFTDENVEEKLCSLCSEKNCEVNKETGKVKTFYCIAAKSVEQKDSKKIGSQLIGILKADVDRLGLIFSLGLGGSISISRYVTLSRMLNLFFAGYVEELCHNEFQNIYTVYSGGDDLLLISDWRTIIEFSKKLYFDFKKFTCENKDISLSAGITLIKPNFPISRAIHLAEESLKMSKDNGRNRITLFDTTVEWINLDALFSFAEKIDKEFNREGSKINSAFLYRLLKYHNMYLNTKKDKYDIRNLLYHSLMAYDVKRNIIQIKKENGQTKIVNEELINELQKLYKISLDPQEEILMKNLKIPLFWVLYKNRGRK
ncbi:MAG: type III-A CRISPR-associated protein Cas10/Csm1 [Endomicrobiia bacterium]